MDLHHLDDLNNQIKLVPRGTTEENFDFPAYLRKAVGAEFELDIERACFWGLRVLIAQSYQKIHIFFACDAAHGQTAPRASVFAVHDGHSNPD